MPCIRVPRSLLFYKIFQKDGKSEKWKLIKSKTATPVNWKAGDEVIISPGISTEDARRLYPKGLIEIKPYLRYTPNPDKIRCTS